MWRKIGETVWLLSIRVVGKKDILIWKIKAFENKRKVVGYELVYGQNEHFLWIFSKLESAMKVAELMNGG